MRFWPQIGDLVVLLCSGCCSLVGPNQVPAFEWFTNKSSVLSLPHSNCESGSRPIKNWEVANMGAINVMEGVAYPKGVWPWANAMMSWGLSDAFRIPKVTMLAPAWKRLTATWFYLKHLTNIVSSYLWFVHDSDEPAVDVDDDVSLANAALVSVGLLLHATQNKVKTKLVAEIWTIVDVFGFIPIFHLEQSILSNEKK